MRKTGVEPITSLEDPIDEPEREPYQGRLVAFRLVIIALFAILLRQLWVLQIVQGEEHRQLADNNRFRVMSVEAPRGVMYDRNHILLTRNTPSYTISIMPADLPKQPEPVYERLGVILGMPADKIIQLVELPPKGKRTTDSFTPVPIKTNVNWEVAFTVEERHLDLSGVLVQAQPIREYLDGAVTSQIIGYVGAISKEQYEKLKGDAQEKYQMNDRVGQTGLELILEHELRGEPGERDMEVDATGREVETLFVKNPVPGHNVRLSIDIGLQREIARILQQNIDLYGGLASVIAMDPRNGQILAMVSVPSYDNNLFSKGITTEQLSALLNDPKKPLVNHAISDVNAPGSTFKIVNAAGSLQEGVVTKFTKIFDPGYILIPNPWGGPPARMVCWAAHGTQDMISALANSCDTYFYTLGGGPANGEWQGLGADRLAKYARLFGFGAATGIDLPGEASGNIPTEDWKKLAIGEPWYKGDTYNMAIGQGFVTATPLQLAVATTALVNGIVYKPQLIMEITDSEGNIVKPYKPEIVRHLPVEQGYLEVIKDGLRAGMLIGKTDNGTAYVGTSYDSEVPGLNIAGKTGTAQYGVPDQKGDMPTHGWFTALAPRENPEIVVTAYIDKGGGKNAGNLVAEIMRYYFRVPQKKN
ncbi:MAG: penicillin-binding protein 2 [Chloroflexi bacterium]|nr:penicillin-binding protein 2 [Chloroflexota bacterium]